MQKEIKTTSQQTIEAKGTVFPKNFGKVNDKLYRGSWPITTSFLSELSIAEVITLYSSNDEKEAQWITELKAIISNEDIVHTIIDVQSSNDLWAAAQHIYESDNSIYIHCQAGANRTSMACLISEIQRQGSAIASESIPALVEDAMSYGFDYHKQKYKQILSDILTQAKQKGLILSWFLP